jgi:hypothetical protein
MLGTTEGYNLYFINENTGYAYRVTAGGLQVFNLRYGNNVGLPEETLSIIDTARLQRAPADAAHPIIPYIPITASPDPYDSGAIGLVDNPRQGREDAANTFGGRVPNN